MKKFHKALLFSVLALFLSKAPLFAQTQFMGWGASFQNYKLTSTVGLYFDAQWRSTDQVSQMHALLLRPGLNVYFTPRLTGTVGYAFIPQQRIAGGVEGYIPEHRVWQQLLYTHPMRVKHHMGATLAHRLRLEQRYLPKHHAQGGQLVHDGHRYAGRVRYFARGILPLSKQDDPKTAFSKGWFAALQNEVFFNIGDVAAMNGKYFDQNRALVAAGYRLNRQLDLEAGYMNQYISGAGSASTNNHIVQLATYLRL